MAKKRGMTKAQMKEAIARAVHAGEPCDCETVDFSDPNRGPTCLEIDFPIIPINQIAAIEGNAGKPIYQMSKWWARRRSSVFRSLLLAAAMKAPDDPAQAAKAVWDAYYRNHQINGKFKHLKVADIFMGGGTTIVEGSRLGMQMYGNDYNPVAWFIVKNEMAKVDKAKVEKALAAIEAEVKPQIMPFYTCDCPRGHKGKWTRIADGKVMGEDFNPLGLSPEERKGYSYHGPEIIYVFWSKHGPCQVRGCGHRTPIMSSPVMAVKELSVKYWERTCTHCHGKYDVEAGDARMAPGVPLVTAEEEKAFTLGVFKKGDSEPTMAVCPLCGQTEKFGTKTGDKLGKPKSKKVPLSLLVHPEWLAGEASIGPDGKRYGGSADDDAASTAAWNHARASKCRLLEVRGELPEEVTCPETGVVFSTSKATVPKKSNYACGNCGTVQDILTTVRASGKTGPMAVYAIQGYCPDCDQEGKVYGGRFFAPVTNTANFDNAMSEWEQHRDGELLNYWPRSEIPYGFMTALTNGGIRRAHGFTHWWKMFNPRQLLLHSILLRTISECDSSDENICYILGAFQQYLRNQNMFCFWDLSYDKLVPSLSNSNFHPKNNIIENSFFPIYGRGNWRSCCESLVSSLEWSDSPWEIRRNGIGSISHDVNKQSSKSEKLHLNDSICPSDKLVCTSSTDLIDIIQDSELDLVITDPPFGGLLHYSELSDFFYVWLRLLLKEKFPNYFGPDYTPKTLEAVSNSARHPENHDAMYERLLTACWSESHRILKPGGLMAFTYHHSDPRAWFPILESLFSAGFVLIATYPIRSDESKGEGEFGSKKIEFDIIHVCRKRLDKPERVSWPKMRRAIMDDVAGLKDILELHQKSGLGEADLQVIRIGKALEYYSRHYGQVYKNDDEPLSVQEALEGILNIIDDGADAAKVRPPEAVEPATARFLSLFDGRSSIPRDQFQKSLRATTIATDDYVRRGWCEEKNKVFHLVSPLKIAQSFHGQKRQRISADYDQAALLVGACHENSGINALETLENANFHPHPSLGPLLEWLKTHGADNTIRAAADTAHRLFKKHQTRLEAKDAQRRLF